MGASQARTVSPFHTAVSGHALTPIQTVTDGAGDLNNTQYMFRIIITGSESNSNSVTCFGGSGGDQNDVRMILNFVTPTTTCTRGIL